MPFRTNRQAYHILTKAIHYRHNDNHRRDSEHDTGKRNGGYQANPALSFLGPQVTHRNHALYRAKGLILPACKGFYVCWRIQLNIRIFTDDEVHSGVGRHILFLACGAGFNLDNALF